MPQIAPVVRILATLALLCSAAGERVATAGDNALVWKTIESEHFVVNYYEPNGELARQVAYSAERSHRILVAALRYAPTGKTQIVLVDDTDGANGFASVAPRNQIVLFATAPSSLSNLNDYDDWLFSLVLHEYAHIVHLNTTSGLPVIWNKIWGKNWMPNQIQPRWVIEGLATYEESKRTSGGRTRNNTFDMFMRVASIDRSVHSLDVMSSGPRQFPGGNVAYLYGSSFFKYIADHYGDDVVAHMSHRYGGHPIPWDLGRAFRDKIGKTVDELYDEWVLYLRHKYAVQIDAIQRRGVRAGTRLTRSGPANVYPRYSADGSEIFWIRSDGYSRPRLRRMPASADESASRDLVIIDGAGAFAVLPDGAGLVAARGYTFRTNYSFADLIRYDSASDTVTRLTHGRRAREPDVSPDGRQLVFCLSSKSKTTLALMPLVKRAGGAPAGGPTSPTDDTFRESEDAPHQVIWNGEGPYDQAATPAWSPDGNDIVFSAWTAGGYRDLFVYHVATKSTERLMRDRALDILPRWSPDGRWIYFASDRTSVFNLFALNPKTRELKQVSNVIGGVFTFDVSPSGEEIVYSGFVGDDYELFRLDIDEANWLPAEVYVNDRPDAVPLDPHIALSAPRAYRPLETLAPDYWQARLSLDSFGSAVTVSTHGADVAGHHAYSLGATVGQTRGDVSVGLNYSYNRLWPQLGMSLGRGIRRLGGLIVDGNNLRYTAETYALTTGVGLPVLRAPESNATVFLAYDVDWLRNIDGRAPLDPNLPVPTEPKTSTSAGVALRFFFSNAQRYNFTIGGQEGRSFGLGVTYSHPALGSDVTSLQLSYSWQEFFAMPWPGHHSLAYRQVGGVFRSESGRDSVFGVGGIPNQDIASAIINSTRVGNTGYLRGYPPGVVRGSQYHLANLEYRVPIVEVERGLTTLPVYVRRLHVAALFDVGSAFDDFSPDLLRYSVGGSLRLDASFGFFVDGMFDLGVARGLAKDGETQVWLFLTNTI